ncbi:MAG TPA: LamG-like jellyroll fold domain-containing protein, partial [Verrucomicrobiae bacterium]
MADKNAWTGAALVRVVSSNWLTEDVGAVGVSGTVSLSGGVFTVQGAGADIWYNGDAFRYVFQALSGDCSITARVVAQQNTADWAKAGVMIRETLDPSSQYVFDFISPANGAALQERVGSGAAASSVSNNTDVRAPYWLRLVRAGNVFTAAVSADGVIWTPTGSTTVTMSANVYVGLAVCSVNEGTLGQAQFDHVSFSTSSAAVISSPLPTLIHRWSFNETGGGRAHDSVGGADGILNGQACFDGQGRVILDGSDGSFVSLPGKLLAGLSNVTIEAWVTNAMEPDNVALFSFDDGLRDGIGGGYLRYVLHDQTNSRNFLELCGTDGSPLIAGHAGLGARSVHLVCVYDPVAGRSVIYTNGVLEKSEAVSTPLANVSPNNAALGRSPWDVDPWLKGAIDEF